MECLFVLVNTTECAFAKVTHDSSKIAVAMYIMLVVIGLCAVPLVVVFIQWKCSKRTRGKNKCFSFNDTDEANLLETASISSSNAAPLTVYDKRLEERA